MNKEIQKFVRECQVCQINKGETVNTPFLLHPLHIPTKMWEDISMDLFTSLPKSEFKNDIFVVMDRLTK